MLPVFNSYFGEDVRKHVCSFVFEPNILNTKSLKEIDDKYNRAGFPVVAFTEIAVGNFTGSLYEVPTLFLVYEYYIL